MQVQETGQVSLPTLIHSFIACDRIRVSPAPAPTTTLAQGVTHTHTHAYNSTSHWFLALWSPMMAQTQRHLRTAESAALGGADLYTTTRSSASGGARETARSGTSFQYLWRSSSMSLQLGSALSSSVIRMASNLAGARDQDRMKKTACPSKRYRPARGVL